MKKNKVEDVNTVPNEIDFAFVIVPVGKGD